MTPEEKKDIRRSWRGHRAGRDLIDCDVSIGQLQRLTERYRALGVGGPAWNYNHGMWMVYKFSAVRPGMCNHTTHNVGSISALLDVEAVAAQVLEQARKNVEQAKTLEYTAPWETSN